jgi:hypothetical protein
MRMEPSVLLLHSKVCKPRKIDASISNAMCTTPSQELETPCFYLIEMNPRQKNDCLHIMKNSYTLFVGVLNNNNNNKSMLLVSTWSSRSSVDM